MISNQDIEKIARLSRLALSAEEKQRLGSELGNILDYVKKLSDLNLKDVPATAHAVEVTNVFREDEILDQEIREAVLQQAPDSEAGFFLVPRVIG